MDQRNGVTVPYLRAWREYNLLTQQELADHAGVNRVTVVGAEQGERIRVVTVGKLAAALGVDRKTLVYTRPPQRQSHDQ